MKKLIVALLMVFVLSSCSIINRKYVIEQDINVENPAGDTCEKTPVEVYNKIDITFDAQVESDTNAEAKSDGLQLPEITQ